MKTQGNKHDQDNAVESVVEWWFALQENPGGRAELRRAASLHEVIFCPAYHRLYHAVVRSGWTNRERVALIAGALAHIRQDDPSDRFAAQLARPRGVGLGAVLSGLRFRRLLQLENPEELYPKLIRVLRLLGGTANMRSLASDLYWWTSERTRREWAFRYYEKATKEA